MYGQDLDRVITNTRTGQSLYLMKGQYINKQQMVESQALQAEPILKQPKWMPDHPDNLWHPRTAQEVKIVGIVEYGGSLLYQIKAINSPDAGIREVAESQLQTLGEADRAPSNIDGKVPINLCTQNILEGHLKKFVKGYPFPSDKRKAIEQFTGGYCKQIVAEKEGDAGYFLGDDDFRVRMERRQSDFPWGQFSQLLNYQLPDV